MREATQSPVVRTSLAVRHRGVGRGSLLGWLLVGSLMWGVGDAMAQADRCSGVQPGGDIHFRNLVLRETPDIESAEIRRINVLVSNRCYSYARDAMQRYKQAHPDDYQIGFIESRTTWMFNGNDAGRSSMEQLLKEHPDFASAKILLASLYLDAKQLKESTELLNQVATTHPNDLWLFMDRLKMEAREATADTVKKASEVLSNPEFPPSAREASALMVIHAPPASPQQIEEAYRKQLTFESASPLPMKARNFAAYLLQNTDRYKEVIDIVKKAQTQDHAAAFKDDFNLMLSLAYLSEAAAINPEPNEKNAALIKQALELMPAESLEFTFKGSPKFAHLRKLVVPEKKATSGTQ